MKSLASPVSSNLACHPATPSSLVDAIDVRVEYTSNGILALSFELQGNLASLRIPEKRPGDSPGTRVDKLWQHTCFEAFLMAGDGPGYREYNFSPSGEWAAYAFRDYRQQTEVLAEVSTPVTRLHHSEQQLILEAEVPLELPPLYHSMRIALSAVVEAADGSLSYWALGHTPGKPDFHHVDAFSLKLDWP